MFHKASVGANSLRSFFLFASVMNVVLDAMIACSIALYFVVVPQFGAALNIASMWNRIPARSNPPIVWALNTTSTR